MAVFDVQALNEFLSGGQSLLCFLRIVAQPASKPGAVWHLPKYKTFYHGHHSMPALRSEKTHISQGEMTVPCQGLHRGVGDGLGTVHPTQPIYSLRKIIR
ncbi:hypothetical protein [Roseovarius sp.]|uniref:hypothetical protein n=1 Tax=Roseovarius sp. TaxID=1486281 RepID=UPI002636BF3E|nr:hypothetical protein [Roseovarius sp.]